MLRGLPAPEEVEITLQEGQNLLWLETSTCLFPHRLFFFFFFSNFEQVH